MPKLIKLKALHRAGHFYLDARNITAILRVDAAPGKPEHSEIICGDGHTYDCADSIDQVYLMIANLEKGEN